ncbi:MAG TPA: hypothetical protein VGQ28_02695, partial [Thermoanaerobaculia bacterium]|nr:hypothetical protein [Thermoanaerobaculia bacterium]
EAEVDLAEGLSALERGDAAAAIDWLVKAAELDPEKGTPHYRQGIALLRMGRMQEAAAEIEASLAAPQPVDDRGLLEGTVGLSAAEDSNPHLLSNNLSLPAPGSGGHVVRGEESDGLARVDLRLGIYPFHAKDGPNLGVTLETRRSFLFDFGYLDLGQARGAVQLAFGSDRQGFVEGPLGSARIPFDGGRFTALFQAGGAVYRLGNDPFLHTFDGAAVLSVRETPGTSTRLDLGYSDRHFSSGPRFDPQRSGQNLSLGLSQLFYFGRPNRTLRLGASGVDRRAGPEFRGSYLEGNGELVWPLGLRLSAVLEGRVREDHYDRRESNLFDPTGPPRRDMTVQSAAALVWAASDRLRWTLRGAYTRRHSNVDLGDGLPDLGYRRTVISAGLSWEL